MVGEGTVGREGTEGGRERGRVGEWRGGRGRREGGSERGRREGG